MPVASAMTAVYGDCLVQAFNAPWSEVQPLVFGVKSFLLTFHNGQTDR